MSDIPPQTHNVAVRSIESLPTKKGNYWTVWDFVKKVDKLHGRIDKGQINSPTLEFLLSSMTIDINVLGPLMRNWIAGNSNGTLIVTIKKSGSSNSTLISTNQHNHTISFVVVAIIWYSTSMENRETIFCFLLFYEIRDLSKKMKKPIIGLRLVWSLT